MIPARRVLVAVDFSESSGVAVAFASLLAARAGADLQVLHALDPERAEAARLDGIDLLTDTRESLGRFLHSRSRNTAGHVDLHVVIGAPATTICAISCREQADIAVIGGPGAVGGSTVDEVLRRTTVSTIVVPEDCYTPLAVHGRLTGLGPVIAGVDGSEPSLAAAAGAACLATLLETWLEIVHVVAEAGMGTDVEASLRPGGLHLSPPPHLRIKVGQVAESLADVAMPRDGRQPILVIGRRSSRAHGEVPGSVASRIVALAHAPVMMYVPDGLEAE